MSTLQLLDMEMGVKCAKTWLTSTLDVKGAKEGPELPGCFIAVFPG